ncbi:leucine carboxyl methyltransferase 1 [Pseudohyphozyma bogoriensis]|nr:leucine carboxyl methyltransferase 1 [Pseudohyphozyma bogoriensis]
MSLSPPPQQREQSSRLTLTDLATETLCEIFALLGDNEHSLNLAVTCRVLGAVYERVVEGRVRRGLYFKVTEEGDLGSGALKDLRDRQALVKWADRHSSTADSVKTVEAHQLELWGKEWQDVKTIYKAATGVRCLFPPEEEYFEEGMCFSFNSWLPPHMLNHQRTEITHVAFCYNGPALNVVLGHSNISTICLLQLDHEWEYIPLPCLARLDLTHVTSLVVPLLEFPEMESEGLSHTSTPSDRAFWNYFPNLKQLGITELYWRGVRHLDVPDKVTAHPGITSLLLGNKDIYEFCQQTDYREPWPADVFEPLLHLPTAFPNLELLVLSRKWAFALPSITINSDGAASWDVDWDWWTYSPDETTKHMLALRELTEQTEGRRWQVKMMGDQDVKEDAEEWNQVWECWKEEGVAAKDFDPFAWPVRDDSVVHHDIVWT